MENTIQSRRACWLLSHQTDFSYTEFVIVSYLLKESRAVSVDELLRISGLKTKQSLFVRVSKIRWKVIQKFKGDLKLIRKSGYVLEIPGLIGTIIYYPDIVDKSDRESRG